jgi:carboxypeptidase family protein
MTSHPPPSPATPRRRLLVLAAALAILAAACGQAATSSPSASASAPAPSASASDPASVGPTTPEAAAALVLASDSRFTGIKPKNPDLIGGCCFYEVTPKGNGYTVMVEIGWGDCPAGCINRHHWFYTVTGDGTVTFDKEDGPAVPTGVPGTATGNGSTAGGGSDTGGGFDTSGGSELEADGIRGTALAGPTCAVATVDDPNCADRPVAGATIHVIDATGVEVARLTTDEAGTFQVALAPGPYQLRADPVESAMSAPPPTDVVVEAGMVVVELSYETGIR